MKKTRSLILVFFFIFTSIFASFLQSNSLRSFDVIFSGLEETHKTLARSPEGLLRAIRADEKLIYLPAPESGIDLYRAIQKINPSCLVESLSVIPYQGRILHRLDAYNALGNIRDLKGRTYHSQTKDTEVPLFEDATRIGEGRRNSPIPDPPPAAELPFSETVHIRLKDNNFGNSYYIAEMFASTYGIIYTITNTRNLSYLMFPVLKEGKFTAILYMEPLVEGMLIYSMAGADASDFAANMVDIPSAIGKRLAVFNDWICDGIKAAR